MPWLFFPALLASSEDVLAVTGGINEDEQVED